MFIYIHAVDYTILTELDEDINILICSALLVCLPEHKHRAVWLMATKNIKFKSLGIGYIYIKFNGLIVPATAFFQDDVCGKMLLFFCCPPPFRRKVEGHCFWFSVGRGAWRVVRGSEFLVGTLSP